MTVLYVLLGGALGALARFSTGAWLQRWLGEQYPWGTTAVNLVGSFSFGLIFAMFEHRGGMPTPFRLIALSGFMGAFTTFSTLMFEVAALLEGGRASIAALHLIVHVALGLGCVFLGLWLGKVL